MSIDIHRLQYLPLQQLLTDRSLPESRRTQLMHFVDLIGADQDHNFEVNDQEVLFLVLQNEARRVFLDRFHRAPEPNDQDRDLFLQVMQAVQSYYSMPRNRNALQDLVNQTRVFYQNQVNLLTRTEADVTALNQLPVSESVLNPNLERISNLNRDGNNVLNLEEVQDFMRNQIREQRQAEQAQSRLRQVVSGQAQAVSSGNATPATSPAPATRPASEICPALRETNPATNAVSQDGGTSADAAVTEDSSHSGDASVSDAQASSDAANVDASLPQNSADAGDAAVNDASDASSSDAAAPNPANAASGNSSENASSSATPAISDQEVRERSEVFLSYTLPLQLEQLNSTINENSRIADQVPTQINRLDLRHLTSIPPAQANSDSFIRVLAWMHSQLHQNDSVITSVQVAQMLNEHVVDFSGIAPLMSHPRSNEILPERVRRFFSTLSPHYIVTERALEEASQGDGLNLSSVPQEIRQNENLRGFFAMFQALAGSDLILNADDFHRMRLQRWVAMQQAQGTREISCELPQNREIHVIDSLWQMSILERFGRVRDQQVFEEVPAGYLPINPDEFLSRAAIYLIRQLPNTPEGQNEARTIVQEAHGMQLFALAESAIEGLHAEERAHSSDGLPGTPGALSQMVTFLPALVYSGGRFVFSSPHQFNLHPPAWNGVRDAVMNRAEQRHHDRLEAYAALRTVMRRTHTWSFREGLARLRAAGGSAVLQADILQNEVRLLDLESNYTISNPRERDQAWLDMAARWRSGSSTHSHGDWTSRFLTRFQYQNGPFTRTAYQQLANTSPFLAIQDSARAAETDQMGSGGSLFPAFWMRDWADAQASPDGIFDEVSSNVILGGAAIFGGRVFTASRTPRFYNPVWLQNLENSENTLVRGLGHTLSVPRRITGLAPEAWREGNALQRAGYYTHSYLTGPAARFIFPRAYQTTEVESLINQGLRWAERSQQGGLRGFLYRQMATYRASSLTMNPSARAAAEHTMLMTSSIASRAEADLVALETRMHDRMVALLTEIQAGEGLNHLMSGQVAFTQNQASGFVRAMSGQGPLQETSRTVIQFLAQHRQSELRTLIRDFQRDSNRILEMNNIAVTAQSSMGMIPQTLPSAERIERLIGNFYTAVEGIPTSGAGAMSASSRSELLRQLGNLRVSIQRNVTPDNETGISWMMDRATRQHTLQTQAIQRNGSFATNFIIWASLQEEALSSENRDNLTQGVSTRDLPGGTRPRSERVRGSRRVMCRPSEENDRCRSYDFQLGPAVTYQQAGAAEPSRSQTPPQVSVEQRTTIE
ncbi:MAG: hypothetical protein JNK65_09280 [Deltaproteobacteria bacterium]|nr:hypothetical protein [Deltaproteobacteria bacterium]